MGRCERLCPRNSLIPAGTGLSRYQDIVVGSRTEALEAMNDL